MKIRATVKLLKVNKIPPQIDINDIEETMPGEWYAQTISLLKPGKMAVHFLHYPTYISIIVPTKSLNKGVELLKDRITSFLTRNGYSSLIPLYQINSSTQIFKTNSRSMVSHLNQLKMNFQYAFSMAKAIDFDEIEDFNINYLFGSTKSPGKYITPSDILKDLVIVNKE